MWSVPGITGALLGGLLLIGLFAFSRPSRIPPRGPVDDAGRSFGHAWVRSGGRLAWVPDDAIDAHAARARPTLAVELDHAGFSARVPASPTVLAPNGWVAGQVALWSGLSTLLSAAIGMSGALLESHRWDAPGAVAGAAMLLVFALMSSAVAAGLTGLVYGLLALLVAPLVTNSLRKASRTPPTPVRLNGRVLEVGPEQRFHLGRPGREIRLEVKGTGPRLVLSNDAEHVEIPGQASALRWLKDALERVEVEEDGEEAVPEELRAGMQRARTQREGP